MGKEVKQIVLEKERDGYFDDLVDYVASGEFIYKEDCMKFLEEQGYKVVGVNSRFGYDSTDMKFKPVEEYIPELSFFKILIGDKSEWGNYVDGLYCPNIIDNPFVKAISMSVYSFRVSTIKEYNPAPEDRLCDSPCMSVIERDLSKEWMKFLANRYYEYEEHMIWFYKHNKKNIESSRPEQIRLIKQRIQELEQRAGKFSYMPEKYIEKDIKYYTKVLEEWEIDAPKMIKEYGENLDILVANKEERLLREAIRLREKDNFKDNADNDDCLEDLTDTFVK